MKPCPCICVVIGPGIFGGIPNRGDCGAISDKGGRVVFEEFRRCKLAPFCGSGSWLIKASILFCVYGFTALPSDIPSGETGLVDAVLGTCVEPSLLAVPCTCVEDDGRGLWVADAVFRFLSLSSHLPASISSISRERASYRRSCSRISRTVYSLYRAYNLVTSCGIKCACLLASFTEGRLGLGAFLFREPGDSSPFCNRVSRSDCSSTSLFASSLSSQR